MGEGGSFVKERGCTSISSLEESDSGKCGVRWERGRVQDEGVLLNPIW